MIVFSQRDSTSFLSREIYRCCRDTRKNGPERSLNDRNGSAYRSLSRVRRNTAWTRETTSRAECLHDIGSAPVSRPAMRFSSFPTAVSIMIEIWRS